MLECQSTMWKTTKHFGTSFDRTHYHLIEWMFAPPLLPHIYIYIYKGAFTLGVREF